MIKHIFLVAIMTSLAAVTAFAAENPDEHEMRFRNLDRNQDNHVSLYETRDKHRVFHYYQKADTNADGHLDKAEFSAFETAVPDYEVLD